MSHIVVTTSMDIWAYFADIAAGLGGVAGLVGIVLARRALRDSHTARLEAARERQRDRLEAIAGQLEVMNKAAWLEIEQKAPHDDWYHHLVLLDRYLAATNVELPLCKRVQQTTSASEAAPLFTSARHEIIGHLYLLRALDARAADSKT